MRLAVALPALVLAASPLAAAPQVVPLPNPGFEQSAGTLPAAWLPAGPLPAGAEARRDTSIRRTGGASLLLKASAPASLTVVSNEVGLEVGRLYRLRAAIRTEDAFSDPTSRYPTAVPACVSMASFPFTNHSPAVGASSPWRRVETLFLATSARDRVRLHLGANGTATGAAWFDDIVLETVDDIGALVPPETVRWAGRGHRFDDRGWIFLHIEGEPYQRGFQHGSLLAEEIVAYAAKLGHQENGKDGPAGWASLRTLADALFLRGYDVEQLTEMKGIADGAARAGGTIDGRAVDLLDVVTLNSITDIGQLRGALRTTPHALTGKAFTAEDDMAIPDEQHHCSSFAATGPATADGRVVFGQIFMWGGYTGVHWNVLLDLAPTSGHRLTFQTFPGGIHSGADFYVNAGGVVLGETTVQQTPFDATGTPQSSRARRAAQYASSIDDVARILSERNNGLYTNDWPIADVKTDEVAIFLLGTRQSKLWRSTDRPAPFGTPGFLWSNNNNRDPGVRAEYVAHPEDAPFDLMFSPANRDIAFWRFFQRAKGTIDAIAAVNLWASSPINRAHACDGKITTSAMAEKLVFLAHHGKVTLREKFPEKGSRRMPDLPGAAPHLSLGYSTASPVVVGEALARRRGTPDAAAKPPKTDVSALGERVRFESRDLWRGTVHPASDADGWLVSGSAAYWSLLHGLPEDAGKAAKHLGDRLSDLGARLLYVHSREGALAPAAARTAYDRVAPYQVSRIRGTFALHQLRLLLGNEAFGAGMREAYAAFAGRPLAGDELAPIVAASAGREVGPFLAQWSARADLPQPRVEARAEQVGAGWNVHVTVAQSGHPWHLLTAVAIDAGGVRRLFPVEVKGARTEATFELTERPTRLVFNPLGDVPIGHERFYQWPNLMDDFDRLLVVYGTSRQIEANHTLALRFATTLADAYTEVLPRVAKDCEVSEGELAAHDLIVLGGAEDNGLVARLASRLPLEVGRNFFTWQGTTYGRSDDGLLLVLPNPANPKRVLYLILSNSALQLHQMTKAYTAGLPSWALFRGDEVKASGFHAPEQLVIPL